MMEALGLLKLWRNSADAPPNEEETDDEGSFFDLDLKSPNRGVVEGLDEDSKKGLQFIDSPRDVLRSKKSVDFSNSKPLMPVTILHSAPKFKVFMLGFRKSSKCDKAESNGESKANPLSQLSKSSKLEQSNRFSVNGRARYGQAAPVFTRDNSLRCKIMKENLDYHSASDATSMEKPVPRYLKLIKPFYVKISSRMKSTDFVTPSSSPLTAHVNLSPRKFSERSRAGSFKTGTRNSGKSRSPSAAVAPQYIRRRDDSLLEQNDGIQGAILHCKKSFNSSPREYSPLRASLEEQKRCSI